MTGKLFINGYGVSVLEDEKILEIDGGGDVCTTIRIDLMPREVYFTLKSQPGPVVTVPREK